MKSIVQTHLIPRQFVFKVINESLPPKYLRKLFTSIILHAFIQKSKIYLKKSGYNKLCGFLFCVLGFICKI